MFYRLYAPSIHLSHGSLLMRSHDLSQFSNVYSVMITNTDFEKDHNCRGSFLRWLLTAIFQFLQHASTLYPETLRIQCIPTYVSGFTSVQFASSQSIFLGVMIYIPEIFLTMCLVMAAFCSQ